VEAKETQQRVGNVFSIARLLDMEHADGRPVTNVSLDTGYVEANRRLFGAKASHLSDHMVISLCPMDFCKSMCSSDSLLKSDR
jgi:hypothetical protein